LSDTPTSVEVLKPIGPIDVEIDGALHRITIPDNCSGYEAAQLAHMLAFAMIAKYPLDFTTFVREKGIERLFVKSS
jgi:hypothetical protein